jgi:sulfate transport system ATP-binding protein
MSIRLENISKHYGPQIVVSNVNLEVKDGEFLVLLGASGSGKTTVLNIIAGLVEPDKGEVLLHDRNVTQLSPQERNIGFVFQNYALFQYMTVAENIEFGLRVRKVPKSQRTKKRDDLLEMVGLVGLGNRMPSQLSGGQQQRVALARALAIEPDVLLLDEPLGALDAKIRVELRRNLKNIQRKSGVAAILVTHDQEEAFDLGDRIGVMNFGRLIEVGTPQDLYQYPKTEYVASFLGSANLLLGNIMGHQVFLGKHGFPLPDDTISLSSNSRAQILFRPEDIALAHTEEDLGCMTLGKGKIIEKGFNGAIERLRVELPSINGVRAISPAVPYGNPGFMMEVNRSPEQSTNIPLETGSKAWVGIRRLHVISHPGLSFLLVSDGSIRSQSAITLGGYLARMSHAHVLLLGVGQDELKTEEHLLDARKQLGSGMATLDVSVSHPPFAAAISQAAERQPFDLVILGWRPTAGLDQPEQVLNFGEHHLLLATKPVAHLSKALICLESGEPGKDNVNFAGRLLRHMGAEATLLTVLPDMQTKDIMLERVERFLSGGQNSLARFGVPANKKIVSGNLLQAVQEEMKEGEYDLIVLGAPLPGPKGKADLSGVIGSIIPNVEDCSFLIIRSHQYQKLQNRLWRTT